MTKAKPSLPPIRWSEHSLKHCLTRAAKVGIAPKQPRTVPNFPYPYIDNFDFTLLADGVYVGSSARIENDDATTNVSYYVEGPTFYLGFPW